MTNDLLTIPTFQKYCPILPGNTEPILCYYERLLRWVSILAVPTLSSGFVNRDGHLFAETSVSTTATPDDNINAFLAYIHDLKVATLRQQTDESLNIVGVGIGAPNGNYFTGTIEHAPNLSFRGIVPIVQLFKKILQRADGCSPMMPTPRPSAR